MFTPKLNSILLPQFTDTLNIYPSPLYQVSNANWSAFLKGIFQPSRVTARTMGPMEGANWTVRTCICSHWMCGPLGCYWPLCEHHGCSWSVPRSGFCHLPPHPPLPVPSHPTSPSIPPTPSIINTDGRKGRQKIP